MSYTYTDWFLQGILLQCNSWKDSAPVNCIQRESMEDLESLPEKKKNHKFLTKIWCSLEVSPNVN